MISKDDSVVLEIKNLLQKQSLAVLATQGDSHPHTSLMAYAFTDDLRYLLFATSISTRKHQNIIGNSNVSLLVDDRSNITEDFQKAAALTILGKACDVDLANKDHYCSLYLNRHPTLKDFLASPSTAFLRVKVRSYQLVSRFEDVVEYQMGE